jgi:hypothetical protein
MQCLQQRAQPSRGVKQIMCTTTSASSAATWFPNVLAAASADDSTGIC